MLTRSRAFVAFIAACLFTTILNAAPVAAAAPATCTVVDNGSGFDVSWDQTTDDAVIIYRTVDGSGPHWRGRVDAPGLTFSDGPLPNGAVNVDYEIRHRIDPNNGPAIPCTPPPTPSKCVFIAVPTGETEIIWGDADDDATLDLLRSTGGAFTSIHSPLPPGGDYVDQAPPANSSYRLDETVGGVTESFICDEVDYSPPPTPAQLGLPILPNGQVGVTGAGNPTPTSIPMPTWDPGEADPANLTSNICASGGSLYTDFTPLDVWGRVIIPEGARLRFDLISSKEVSAGGNWSAHARLHEMDPNGAVGQERSSFGSAPPYWWPVNPLVQTHTFSYTNPGPTAEFLINIDVGWVSFGVTDDGPKIEMTNFEFVDANGDVIGRPCQGELADECKDAGGNTYLADPITVNGTSYEGCFDNDGCLLDMPLIGGICEGDPWIENLLIAGAVILIVGGVLVITSGTAAGGIVIAGSAAGATTTGTAGAMGVIALGGLVLLTVYASGVAYQVYTGNPAIEGPVDWSGLIPDISAPTVIDDFVAGSATGATVTVADALYDNAAATYESQLPAPDPTDPKLQDRVRQSIKAGLAACAANLTVDIAIAQFGYVFTQLGLPMPQVVDDLNDIDDGQHLCNLIPTIVYGNRSASGTVDQTMATAHIYEAVVPNWPHVWTSQQPPHDSLPGVQNGTQGNTAWLFLNREDKGRDQWYWSAPYSCKADDGRKDNCDEYPQHATIQGGNPARPGALGPVPHLRIISSSANQSSGGSLRAFYRVCSIEPTTPSQPTQESAFIAIPTDPFLLLTGTTPTVFLNC